ncbi:hypothetical protein A8W25_12550 [Streptomyces sp. ERV7]|uniref:SCO4225 family membrane protein n=1 Tax=Streptomyces sp. ERV7 TaxID=1322334 RepID=UPI0007F384A4|nr:hypothetical protein [Streptomyces sp. ERV7]OAR26258.1 hypothetical protein A8W25_12550 [Streptomyces sp. ERV7]
MNARTLIRLTFANPASAIYLGLFGGSVAIAAAVTLFSSDPGFIWVWPALLTFPALLFAVAVGQGAWGTGEVPTWVLVGGLITCALVQSFVLGVLLKALRGRRRGLTHPHHG